MAIKADVQQASGSEAEQLPGTWRSQEEPWTVMQSTLEAIAVLAISLAYVAGVGLMVTHHPKARWDLCAAPAVLLAGGASALALRLSYRIKAMLLIASMCCACLLANLTSRLPNIQIVYACACIVSGMLLGPRSATLVAGLGTVAIVVISPSQPGTLSPVWSVAGLWLVAIVMWTATENLFQAVRHARHDEAWAWRCAQEARVRRGELARAQKSLNETYGLLQRANHELAIARREAEGARHIKAQFAANVSHELRTPLNLIMGFSELMYRSPEVYGEVRWTPSLRADIRQIYASGRHLQSMIEDILDLSAIDAHRLPLRLEPTNLTEVIDEATAAISGLLRGKDVVLRKRVPVPLPEVLADRRRVRQVLLNLLNNAIRFTDRGQIEISAYLTNGTVTVAVSDTGAGIPQEEMKAIFEEFGQAKASLSSGRGGTGLGLAICRQLLRLHGGQIEAESEVGKGTTFRFTLPLPGLRGHSDLSYYAPEAWSPPVPENPLGKTVIVLAPDSEAGAMIARVVHGYRTLPVHSPVELAKRVEAEHPAGIVLVQDSTAIGPLDPDELWQQAGRADLPIIRCELPAKVATAQEMGVTDYLVKPVQREQLTVAVRRACEQPAKILIVDDDPGFVALADRLLCAEFETVQVHKAYSGEQALAILNQETFDLILLDLVMPGMSGLQVIEAIQQDERLATVPVLVITGSGYGKEVGMPGIARVEILTHRSRNTELGQYITALLDALPPDYSRPAPPTEQPASAAETQAS